MKTTKSSKSNRVSGSVERMVSQPRRIQLSRKKGWRLPKNTIVVSRPRHWGNPYRVGPEQSATECVKKFEAFMLRRPSWILAAQQQLRGKNLACWCPLDAPCHANVLLRLANDQAHAPLKR